MQKYVLLAVFTAFKLFSFSQGTFIPLGSNAYDYMNRLDIKYSRIIPIEFTADRPYRRSQVAKIAETLLLSNLRFNKVTDFDLHYLIEENADWLDSVHLYRPRPLLKVLYTEEANFFTLTSKNKGLFDLRINPMLGFSAGAGGGRFIFTRTAGVEVRGDFKGVFSFYFNGTGNDEHTPTYVENVIMPTYYNYATGKYAYAYVPGEAYWKDYNSNAFGYSNAIDYFDARGYVNAYILKCINLTFGRDKNFIGDGDRSLILSDFSAPYLFLKFNVHFWRISYDNIFAQLTSQYLRGADQLLPDKYMALHHLSVQATNWFRIGVFESTIFNQGTNFELQYLNPIIYYHAVETAMGSPDNVLLGGDFKANIAGRVSLYGQLVLDNLSLENFFKDNGYWGNKWATQLGIKYIDILPNLDGQIEFNYVRPFTYTNSDGTSNYTNYNQPLGDPLGANFYEFIFNLHLHPVPWLSFNVKYFIARVGTDTLINGVMSNYGGNIFQPSNPSGTFLGTPIPAGANGYGYRMGMGAKGFINYFEFLISYQAWHNINFDCSLLYRGESTVNSPNNPIQTNSAFIFSLGARINIARRTYEF